jgi:hypothetical protein
VLEALAGTRAQTDRAEQPHRLGQLISLEDTLVLEAATRLYCLVLAHKEDRLALLATILLVSLAEVLVTEAVEGQAHLEMAPLVRLAELEVLVRQILVLEAAADKEILRQTAVQADQAILSSHTTEYKRSIHGRTSLPWLVQSTIIT